MKPARAFFCLLAASLILRTPVFAADAASEMDHLRSFVRAAAGAATVKLESELLADSVLLGVYRSDSPGFARYRLSGPTLVVDVDHRGRETRFRFGQGYFHISPADELSADEFARLRALMGPLGVPLLDLHGLLRLIESDFTRVTASQPVAGEFLFVPGRLYRESVRSWVVFQSGASAQDAILVSPETVAIRLSTGSSRVLQIEQQNIFGQLLSRLLINFDKTPSSAPPAFQISSKKPPIDGRSMVMAMGAGPQWLIGKSIPSGNLKRMDGAASPLNKFKSRPALINFWATWCGPCRVEWPVLQVLYDKYKNDVDFLLVSPEDPGVVRRYIESSSYTAPVYLLTDESLSLKFGLNAFPTTYFSAANGKIREAFVGFPRYASIDRTKAALLEKYEAIIKDMIRDAAGSRSPPKTGG